MSAGEVCSVSSKHSSQKLSTMQKRKLFYVRQINVFLQDYKERRASSRRHCRGSIDQVKHSSV